MIEHADNVVSISSLLPTEPIYQHPRDVLRDRHLSTEEKRAILASWASDAGAVPSQPQLRRLPGSHRLIGIAEILSALAVLDDPPQPPGGKPTRLCTTSRLPCAA